ncbi:MAG: T9SS type A sorting domain-containing protein, partial [Winogradskyella sp.]|nr:T9SS type A sorting domain-containing protein [Winogradskyella sp.]
TKSGGGNVSFLKSMRTTGNSDDFIQGRAESAHLGNFKLTISSIDDAYETDFYFNTNASSGLDPGYDAAMFGGSAPEFSLYSHLVNDNSGVPMAIQALGPNELNGVIISIGIHAPISTNISVSLANFYMPETVNVYLEDSATNTYTLLNENTYDFTASTALNGTGRFYLRIESGTLSTDRSELNELSVFNNSSAKELIISGQLNSSTTLTLYNLHGSILGRYSLNDNKSINKVNVAHLSTGVYIVKLSSNFNAQRIIKLIIR